ncbi:chorismate mutase [Streptomyces hundungensis]|uniref:chorismate mutase n=1 Tax=Streptomyces hundungensis TaxID=1077946 RepID=UPI003401BAAA
MPETDMSLPAVAPNDITSLRSRIDAIDAEITRLVAERRAYSHAIQASRLHRGGPRTELARERGIIERYAASLGPTGIALANLLLTDCRGTLPHSPAIARGVRA